MQKVPVQSLTCPDGLGKSQTPQSSSLCSRLARGRLRKGSCYSLMLAQNQRKFSRISRVLISPGSPNNSSTHRQLLPTPVCIYRIYAACPVYTVCLAAVEHCEQKTHLEGSSWKRMIYYNWMEVGWTLVQ